MVNKEIFSPEECAYVDGSRGEDDLVSNAYWRIARNWQAGDVLHLDFWMQAQNVESHPDLASNRGQIAVRRGPLIYCVEQADNLRPLSEIGLLKHVELEPEWKPDLLGGVMTLTGSGVFFDNDEWLENMYAPIVYVRRPRPLQVTAIPYYTWANREAGTMRVWMPAE